MIHEKISAYYGDIAGDQHHRYRSWEHCYRYFREVTPSGIAAQRNHAALQLAFYLASWGMYRGSTFLLQHAYTVHLGVVDCLVLPRFAALWEREFGADVSDVDLLPVILDAAEAVGKAYSQFGQPTETLVTKVLLGTFGCLPASDQYFIAGFRGAGLGYSYLNAKFIKKAPCVFARTSDGASSRASDHQGPQRSALLAHEACGHVFLATRLRGRRSKATVTSSNEKLTRQQWLRFRNYTMSISWATFPRGSVLYCLCGLTRKLSPQRGRHRSSHRLHWLSHSLLSLGNLRSCPCSPSGCRDFPNPGQQQRVRSSSQITPWVVRAIGTSRA